MEDDKTNDDWAWLMKSIHPNAVEWRRLFLNEFFSDTESLSEPQPVYILASNYQIAKSIFDRYFVYTNLSRRIDLRYVDTPEKLYGLRNIFVVFSDERYPNHSFFERLAWIRNNAQYRNFEVVNEQDLEKEQVRQKVSRQRPKESESK